MKIIYSIQQWLFPVINRQQCEIDKLGQSLKDTSRMYNEQLAKSRALQAELEYIYSIFLHRNRCCYQLHVFPRQSPLLLTVGHKSNWMNFILYTPYDQQEIANLYFRVEATDLVLEEMQVAPLYQNQQIGGLLMQEIISEAKAMGLQRLTGIFGSKEREHLGELARFYEEMGFEVRVTSGSLSGKITKAIAPR